MIETICVHGHASCTGACGPGRCPQNTAYVFHEDLARTRKDHGPENLSILRRLTMNVLRSIPAKGSIAVKRKRAAWSNDYFFDALTYLR
jgi:hypothetical protein